VQDDRGDSPLRERDTNGAIDDVAHLGRGAGLLNESAGDILERARQIHFLLIVTS
jgi:hypothetical protein